MIVDKFHISGKNYDFIIIYFRNLVPFFTTNKYDNLFHANELC